MGGLGLIKLLIPGVGAGVRLWWGSVLIGGWVLFLRPEKKKKKIPCPLGRFLSHFSPAGSCFLLEPPGIGRVKIL